MKKIESSKLYSFISFINSFAFTLIFTVNLVYHVKVVELSPIELVLIGTILELSVFIFEIPTGVVADLKSRKLSIIIGILLTGIAFILEGVFPFFTAILIGKVLWGLGHTFVSGASEAWIADEVGDDRVQSVFLKGAQYGNIGGFLAIPLSVFLGTENIQAPIVLGGIIFIVIGLTLPFIMNEKEFKPVNREDGVKSILRTVKNSSSLIKNSPVLPLLLLVSLFYGIYGEGFDRLWTPHIIGTFNLPDFGTGEPILFFGIIKAITMLLSFTLLAKINKRVEKFDNNRTAKILTFVTVGIITSMVIFGYIGWLWGAMIFFWIIGILRNLNYPLFNTWFNSNIKDSSVRATMFSVRSLIDSVGQVCGGPITGGFANFISIPFSMIVSGILLAPVLPLFKMIKKKQN